MVKKPPTNEEVGDAGWIPGLGRSPGGGYCTPFQCPCLENGVAKSWLLKD